MPTAIAKKLRCDAHGWYDGHVTTFSGGENKYTTCPKCKDIKIKNEKEKQERELAEAAKANKLKKLKSIGVPKRFLKSSFENYKAVNKKQQHALKLSKRYAETFENIITVGTSLIFCGKRGTGKTHLACAIANYLIDKDYKVLFTTTVKCIRQVKQTYAEDSKLTEQQIIDGFVALDLLILDEVGVQFGTATEKMILFEILNDRYEDELPSLLISNLELEEMHEYIGERVIDRMNERRGAIVAFDWESYRQIKL